ncbi:hypothetical protein K2Z84_12400 [Candidatus Binatia bacterium]|nr:hypothetical protein [Candidatus Binatia bacterium]
MRLRALPLRVQRVHCAIAPVAVPSYPDGPRPSSTLVLEGGGAIGRGEHVGWSDDVHTGFAARVASLSLDACTTVGETSALARARLDGSYDRAALEAAAIDLALRQAATDLPTLADAAPQPVRYVLSFERVADPVARARRELTANPDLELKIDADPGWSDAVLGALAALERVAVLDFKQSGGRAAYLRAHRLLPDVLLEDPLPDAAAWPASLCARLALDAPITSAASVAALTSRPAAINVKPSRVGGVLEALDVVAACAERGIDVYLGGMFEVGVGRVLVQTLASLLSPDGPNDVAPIGRAGEIPPRPSRLVPQPPPGGGIAS